MDTVKIHRLLNRGWWEVSGVSKGLALMRDVKKCGALTSGRGACLAEFTVTASLSEYYSATHALPHLPQITFGDENVRRTITVPTVREN